MSNLIAAPFTSFRLRAVATAALCATLGLASALAPGSTARALELPTIQINLHRDADHVRETELNVGERFHPQINVFVSSKTIPPTGQLSVTVYEEAFCQEPGPSASGQLANGSFDATQASYKLYSSGQTICIQASYGGDANYAATNATRLVTVQRGVLALTFDIHQYEPHESVTVVEVGTQVHGWARLAWGGHRPTGAVVVRRFSDGSCGNVNAAITIGVNPDGYVDGANAWTPPGAGTYSYGFAFQGDADYEPVAEQCRTFTVRNIPTINASIHNEAHSAPTSSAIKVGETVHLKVSSTGTIGTVQGKIRVLYFLNGTCAAPAEATSPALDIAGTLDVTSFPQTPPAGVVSFQADYEGSTLYQPRSSGCKSLTVNKHTPGFTQQLVSSTGATVSNGSTVRLETPIAHRVTVTGKEGLITGSVRFETFTGSATCAGEPVHEQSVGVSGGIAQSDPTTVSAAGPRSFRATYRGSPIYAPVTGACLSLVVKTDLSGMDVSVHSADHRTSPLYAFQPLHADVGLTFGSGVPTGTLTGNVYANGSCSGAAVATSPAAAGPSVEPAVTWTAGGPGQYSLRVAYSGNATYFSTSSGCVAFSVVSAGATVSPGTSPGAQPTGSPAAGSSVAPTTLPAQSGAPAASPLPDSSQPLGATLEPGPTEGLVSSSGPSASAGADVSGSSASGLPGSSSTPGDPAASTDATGGFALVVGLFIAIVALLAGAASWRLLRRRALPPDAGPPLASD